MPLATRHSCNHSSNLTWTHHCSKISSYYRLQFLTIVALLMNYLLSNVWIGILWENCQKQTNTLQSIKTSALNFAKMAAIKLQCNHIPRNLACMMLFFTSKLPYTILLIFLKEMKALSTPFFLKKTLPMTFKMEFNKIQQCVQILIKNSSFPMVAQFTKSSYINWKIFHSLSAFQFS